ncbi:MAG TPA: 4-(cytidine 5'-diphospho)-2-C-methyl-D-erythritol kinase [Candidatus Hydrogenedentes bacterium]|nr:4-(cytidine 5'-diphospho)-2-C-methyl-D-erythritol kinase [Candidatus Hydrogenedentota bacterium]HRZ82157.1 4-(cytidine 5'-diphospho)-2-C-methyl-D-erythritol kinase [Candidatus Hydrogenedentota bacterium]
MPERADGGGRVVESARAKINLYLDVVRRREDGFHDIETLFQSLDLADEVALEPRGDGRLTLECSLPGLCAPEDNLALRAAALLRRHTGCRAGAHIRLEKRIPVAAGLAGGSADAAAALRGLNRLWGLALTHGDLAALALELGSDVPYCLTGGLAAARGRGECLTPLPPLPGDWHCLLVDPGIPVRAAQAYTHPLLEKCGPPPEGENWTPRFRQAAALAAEGRLPELVFNRLERPVFHDHPLLAEIKEALLARGARAAAMSGSGSVMFGLFRHADPVGDAAAAVAQSFPGVSVLRCGFSPATLPSSDGCLRLD